MESFFNGLFQPISIHLGVMCLTCLFALPVVYRIYRLRARKRLRYEIYSNIDGMATTESMRRFSNTIILLFIMGSLVIQLLLFMLLVGLVILGKGAHLPAVYWLQGVLWVSFCSAGLIFWAWIFSMMRIYVLRLDSDPHSRVAAILYGSSTSILTLLLPYLVKRAPSDILDSNDSGVFAIRVAQVVSGTLCAVGYLSLARRPDVYFNETLVDRQHSCSIIELVTFAWAKSILEPAKVEGNVPFEDLPRLRNTGRSSTLQPRLEDALSGCGLLVALLRVHYPAFLLQQLLTIAQACMSLTPQLALLRILESLEGAETSNSDRKSAYIWVMVLGLFMITSLEIESWLYWLVISKLSVPIRGQLSSVIYSKSLLSHSSKKGGGKQDKVDKADIDNFNSQAYERSTVNLIAVDVKRASDGATYNYIISSAILKIFFAFVFLFSLLGCTSSLAGISLGIFIVPINALIGHKLKKSQSSLMSHRDEKASVIAEALKGIRQVKFSAEESQWQTKISNIRRAELQAQWECFGCDIKLMAIWVLAPTVSSVISLGAYALVHGDLTPSVAFTTIAIFGSLESSLANLPDMISSLLEAFISLTRIQDYLKVEDNGTTTSSSHTGCIEFKNAAVAYPAISKAPDNERLVLRCLNFTFPSKALSIISGKTGSGKSLILSAILGECDVLDGSVNVPPIRNHNDIADNQISEANWIVESSIAYVAQSIWMENSTIKENILFGLPHYQSRYESVLSACGLTTDIEMLPEADLTLVGANAVRLSGGQKWRLSLARALYSRAGILLIDDIFSAVDMRTRSHLYDNALTGPLAQNRTRILVTHHLSFCDLRTDFALLLAGGTAKPVSQFGDLRSTGSQAPENFDDTTVTREIGSATSEDSELRAGLAESFTAYPSPVTRQGLNPAVKPSVDHENERRQSGAVSLNVYRKYFKAGVGSWFWIPIVAAYISFVLLSLGRSWWINIWTGAKSQSEHSLSVDDQLSFQTHEPGNPYLQRQETDGNLWFYLSVYLVLCVLASILGAARFLLVLIAAVRASRQLFDHLLFTILNSPLQWLENEPIGRILNRFTSDFNLIDSRLGYDIGAMLHRLFEIFGIVCSAVFVSPITILISLIPVLCGLYLAPRYLKTAREIKRLESIALSPIFDQCESTLAGLWTIRAFDKSKEYALRMNQLLDRHGQTCWHLWLTNRWFNFRMNLVGILYCLTIAIIVVFSSKIGSALAGFTLSFAFQYPAAILWAIRGYANVELNMNSAERVFDYANLCVENQDGEEVPESWPNEGRLEVRNLNADYGKPPMVLKDLSFVVQPGQKIAVIGRTGAGKSSLSLALFRFIKQRSGSIIIDGIDTSKIKLHDLRNRLKIIPQNPVIFAGTVRSNLDPFHQYTDEELYEALERVHFRVDANSAAGQPGVSSNLSSPIWESGNNLSVGQRQLLCLARAILSRPKILILDEATSAIDTKTDALIQETIRIEASCHKTTLLVIAHRLSNIVDFDVILVMDAGKIVESGSPRQLLGRENSIFRSLVHESNDRQLIENIIFDSQ